MRTSALDCPLAAALRNAAAESAASSQHQSLIHPDCNCSYRDLEEGYYPIDLTSLPLLTAESLPQESHCFAFRGLHPSDYLR